MSIEEYFSDWIKCIDKNILFKCMNQIDIKTSTPDIKNWFKAFELCSYNDLKIVMLGYDPYPQKGVATGVLFGNSENTIELSPSLNIIKESCINLEVPRNSIIFDPTLESWCRQGILMLNSALTTKIGQTGAHTMIWRPFIKHLLIKLSEYNTGIIYVLFGDIAKSFKPFIGKNNIIIEEKHPAYYARTNTRMPSKIFTELEQLIKLKYNEKIKFYEEVSLY